jgi:hypothetical protein
MKIPVALAADLQSLTDALDQPGIDLQTHLETLAVGIRNTVASYLGVTMTLLVDGYPAEFTVLDSAEGGLPVAASLRLPLEDISVAEPGGALVLYASTPGAFVDLAADLAHILRIPLHAMVLDQQLTPPTNPTTLTDVSRINQAIGVLIGGGQTPAQAREELNRLAAEGDNSLAITAQNLLDNVTANSDDEQPGL